MNYNKIISDFRKTLGELTLEDIQLIKENFEIFKVKKGEQFSSEVFFYVNTGLLRSYFKEGEEEEYTRRLAWERKPFISTMKTLLQQEGENYEIIECIEDAEILVISKKKLENLLSKSIKYYQVYTQIIEQYIRYNNDKTYRLMTKTDYEKVKYFYENYPELIGRVTDCIIATFLGVSRRSFSRHKGRFLKEK